MKKVTKKRKVKKGDVLKKGCNNPGDGGAVYGLGFIGAVIYFLSTATGFWVGVLGVLKAIVWPVFLVIELFKFLGM